MSGIRLFQKCLLGATGKTEILSVLPQMIAYDRAQLPPISTGVTCKSENLCGLSIQSDIPEISGYLWEVMNNPYMKYLAVIGVSTQKTRERGYEELKWKTRQKKNRTRKKAAIKTTKDTFNILLSVQTSITYCKSLPSPLGHKLG